MSENKELKVIKKELLTLLHNATDFNRWLFTTQEVADALGVHRSTLLRLLYENPAPTAEEVKRAIDGNLCRCTGYNQIIKSVEELKLNELVL